ncbi:MAG: FAD-dependent oxidoreductase [Candidatus Lokiarchaeota archaeon]|nr:FAD-dependent oxidoreductase [Candidatus Lokiarchaeota archaeon]
MSDEKKFYFDKYTGRPLYGFYNEAPKNTPIVDNVDILVVGGSQSGVCAAISAARHGAKVLIAERFGFLGGQSVYGMVTQWEKRAFVNNLGAVLTKGLPEEILNKVIEKGGSDNLWFTPPGAPEMRDGEEWLNPEAIKITFFEMCEEEGIDILLHTLAVDVMLEKKEDKLNKMTGVIFENKTGRFAIAAKVVIDATADLDLIWRAQGEQGCGLRDPINRMGQGFYVWYGNIDTKKFMEWYSQNPSARGGYPKMPDNREKVMKNYKESKLIKIGGTAFREIMEKAEEKGYLDKIGDILEELGVMMFVTLGMKWVGDDRWSPSFLGIPNLNMLDAWQVTDYEIFRQKLAFYMLPIMRLIPGWENAYISRENIYMGSRETRWLKAMKMIDQSLIWDPENATKPTPLDAIGRSGAHDPGKNKLRAGYPIPYGIYVPKALDGALVCARACGTKPDRALDAHRGITPNMVAGQGVGTAAAIAVEDEVEPRNINLEKLQNILKEDGVQLDHEHMDFDFQIPKDKIRDKPRPSE